MSTDELLHQFDDLRFTVDGQDVVYATPVGSDIAADDSNFSIVGRVFTTAEVDGATLIHVFRARGPWVFNNDWFALLPLNPMLSIDEYHFNRMVIWVRTLRVPIGLMNEVLGRSLGACIGMVVGTDTRVIDGNMGEFLRVCISIDVTKPLRRCVALGGCGNKPKLCPLKYEKLPNFCHGCGHTAKYQYGDWLRAPVKKRQEAIVQSKGRILFHEDGGNNVPCTKQSIPIATTPTQPPAPMNAIPVSVGPVLPSCSPREAVALAATSPVLVADPVDDVEDVFFLRDEPAAAVDLVSGDVLAVDPMGTVHVSEPSFLGDERDVLVTHSSHLEIVSVKAASNFETIDEWFAEDAETNIPVVVAPPLQVPAKRSSGGANSSKTKACTFFHSHI
ncbi:hypothetical protein GQ457_13G012500 [Hibiscus cannabinus]